MICLQDLVQRFQQFANLEFHDGCVNTVQFSPSGELLVSGSDDRCIVFWDWAAKVKRLHYDSGHESNVFQARIMPFSDDRHIISCGADGQVRLGTLFAMFVFRARCEPATHLIRDGI